MGLYMEGEVPTMVSGNGSNNGFGNGWEGLIGLALVAGLFDGGFGIGGGNRGGSDNFGYYLGQLATTNDVASGFSTSAIMSNQRESQLAMQQGFSDIQQTLCRGFSDINLINERGFATTNFNMQKCCCDIQRGIDGINFNNSRNTCDIIQAINCGNQRIIDYMQNEKICALTSENVALKGQISQANQTSTLLNAINRTPVAAYTVPNPYCCYNNSCCGCNNNGF